MSGPWKFNDTSYAKGGSQAPPAAGGWKFRDTTYAPKPTSHSGGGGGLFGWLGSKLSLAGRDIEGIPGGLYHLADSTIATPLYDAGNAIIHGRTFTAKESRDVTAGGDTVAGIAKSTAQTVEHPLRDPFNTVLTVAPLVGTVGRLGEAGIAAKSAEGGLAAKLAAGGKALAEHGGQPFRTLHVGEDQTPVTLIGSRNAGVRLMQRGYDRMLQRAIDREQAGIPSGRIGDRIGAHAQKRISGAGREEINIQQRMAAVPASLLDRSAMKLSKIPGKSGDRLHQAALELTSVQTPAEEAAAYHYAQAAKGVNADVNTNAAKLYEQVAKRGLVHLDETRPAGAKVYINPAFAKLAKTDAALARVQARGDQILAGHDIMSPQELAARADAPGRIRAGAHYEEPTPGKLGIASPALDAARAELARVSALHERALARDAEWLRATKNRDLGALSPEDAKARLAALDAKYENLVQRMIPHVSPYGGTLSKAEQLDRNFLNSRAGKGRYRAVSRADTVKQEDWNLADAKIRDLAERGTHPAYRQAAELIRERDSLRKALDDRTLAVLGGDHPAALPSAPARAHASVGRPSNPHTNTINYLGNHLEHVQARVARLEAAAARRAKPTGIVGGEHARPGRGYVFEGVSEKKLAKTEAARSQGPVHGVAKEPISKRPYTGRAIESGLRPKDVTGSASRHFRMLQRFDNTDRLRRLALTTGHTLRRSSRDVLLAIPDEAQTTIGPQIRELFGQTTRTVDTADELARHTADVEDAARAEGLRAALQMRTAKWLDRAATSKTDAIGSKAPDGYRWVDENAIQGSLDESRPRGGAGAKLGHAVDDVNGAVTALTVYFKIGHTGTRVLTNAATNLMQGSLKPLDIARSYKLWHAFNEEDRARLLAAAGQHGFSALPHESGDLVGRVAGRGAQFWARHADSPFRFNALAYELRKAGYHTADQTRAALDALEKNGHGLPAHEWSKISAAARRADREAISYDRLNSFEKRYLTRGIWFYPWIKGSTLFTVRSILEHPWKMAVAGNLGVQGRERQQQLLGDVPSYEAGLIPLGGGAPPLTTDFSTFSPFGTAGSVLGAVARPQDISGFLNPVAGAAGQLAYGLNQYGAPSKRPYLDALLALAASTPEQQLAEAYQQSGTDQSNRMFQKTPYSTLLRYLIGPGMPRHANKSALAKAAAREHSGQR